MHSYDLFMGPKENILVLVQTIQTEKKYQSIIAWSVCTFMTNRMLLVGWYQIQVDIMFIGLCFMEYCWQLVDIFQTSFKS